MRQSSFNIFPIIILVVTIWFTGCATIRTMPTLGSYGSPKVYSGTRLDFNAVTGNTEGLRKFKVSPPEYPLADIAFSAALDTIILPLTLPVASYEFVFEK
jgi:uncharacterized protein YceK